MTTLLLAGMIVGGTVKLMGDIIRVAPEEVGRCWRCCEADKGAEFACAVFILLMGAFPGEGGADGATEEEACV
jgi:hypothetical protein